MYNRLVIESIGHCIELVLVNYAMRSNAWVGPNDGMHSILICTGCKSLRADCEIEIGVNIWGQSIDHIYVNMYYQLW